MRTLTLFRVINTNTTYLTHGNFNFMKNEFKHDKYYILIVK